MLFNSPVWPLQKAVKSWRMALDSLKFNQVEVSITTAVPEVIFLL